MKELELYKAFTLIEPGPVIMVTTAYKGRANIMTIAWHMVMDFTPRFALLTGPWNHSYEALVKTKECVLSVPAIDLLDKVVGVGTTSGVDVDKFSKFGLTPLDAEKVKAPLIKECYANIECRVVDHLKKHDIFVLEAVKAWVDVRRKEKTIFHYRGNGTFVADGKTFDRYKQMKPKMAPGL
ncbi:MAG: flavin reductase family protein [Rickettsiales bacterium]|jgi:flavin reductase (DIM6/NTAB) family NADH-FMN oxidoreductase RutF|nr:flavin reductase family protein [Rickettsiales bacterium]